MLLSLSPRCPSNNVAYDCRCCEHCGNSAMEDRQHGRRRDEVEEGQEITGSTLRLELRTVAGNLRGIISGRANRAWATQHHDAMNINYQTRWERPLLPGFENKVSHREEPSSFVMSTDYGVRCTALRPHVKVIVAGWYGGPGTPYGHVQPHRPHRRRTGFPLST